MHGISDEMLRAHVNAEYLQNDEEQTGHVGEEINSGTDENPNPVGVNKDLSEDGTLTHEHTKFLFDEVERNRSHSPSVFVQKLFNKFKCNFESQVHFHAWTCGGEPLGCLGCFVGRKKIVSF